MKNLKNKQGIALITVLLLLVVVGTLISALMTMYSSNIKRAGNDAERNQAFYAAEAGANYLNSHINKNAKSQNIVLQPIMEAELRNLTGDLDDEFFNDFNGYEPEDFNDPIFKYELAKNLELNDFNIDFSFDENSLDRENEIYGFIIEASNDKMSERIRLTYEIQTLPPFFRSSRQANKINIDNSSRFGSSRNFPAHSFATAEKYQYNLWNKNINYSKDDIIHYKGNSYIAKEDHLSRNNDFYTDWRGRIRYRRDKWDSIELEEEPDLRKFNNLEGAVDYGMDVLPPQPPKQFWNNSEDYVKEEKVKHNGKFFISNKDNPTTEPGVEEGWKNDWQEYYNYKSKVVDIFDDLIKKHEGKTYNDNINFDYEVYNSLKSYNTNDIVLSGGRFYQLGEDGWIVIDDNPDLAYRNFLTDSSSNIGPYIKIDGDFTPTENFDKWLTNMKADESGIVHILVDGDINFTTSSNVNLYGEQNVIMYVNGDLNFNPGFINIGRFNGELAYFAPNATFTFKDQYGIGFGSSMVVNELNIENSYISNVSYDTEDSPLIGKMNPKIAELSRSFATQHGEGTVSQINPKQEAWERLK